MQAVEVLESLTLHVDTRGSEHGVRYSGLLSFGLCSSSGFLNNAKEHNISETGFVPFLR
jgi:hypothetical protein